MGRDIGLCVFRQSVYIEASLLKELLDIGILMLRSYVRNLFTLVRFLKTYKQPVWMFSDYMGLYNLRQVQKYLSRTPLYTIKTILTKENVTI